MSTYERSSYLKRSKYDFPREKLSEVDWKTWVEFWKKSFVKQLRTSHTLGGLEVLYSQGMGVEICSSHEDLVQEEP